MIKSTVCRPADLSNPLPIARRGFGMEVIRHEWARELCAGKQGYRAIQCFRQWRGKGFSMLASSPPVP